MANKRVRMNISVSFSDDEIDIYNHAKNKPNSSHYVKELIRLNMAEEIDKEKNIVSEIDIDDITNMFF